MNGRLLLAVPAGLVLLMAAAWDVRTGRIPDWLSWPALVMALVFRGVTRGLLGPGGLAEAAAGAVALGFVTSLLALWGKMGWGDVKLLAAVGAAFGWPLALDALFAISLVGALQAAVSLGLRDDKARGSKIPYGVAIAAGSVVTGLTDLWFHG
ncbi:MAG: prepilin peptidase [Deltaproteobacteria bacterium]